MGGIKPGLNFYHMHVAILCPEHRITHDFFNTMTAARFYNMFSNFLRDKWESYVFSIRHFVGSRCPVVLEFTIHCFGNIAHLVIHGLSGFVLCIYGAVASRLLRLSGQLRYYCWRRM